MPTTVAQMVADASARVEAVTPQTAFAALSTGDAVILDVREPVEWGEVIDGAVQVPRGLVEFAADPASPRHNPALDPNARVIVHCRSGVRSVLAAATLQDLGYTNVANMTGGITAWKAAGLPIHDAHEGI